jgi:predicted ATPase
VRVAIDSASAEDTPKRQEAVDALERALASATLKPTPRLAQLLAHLARHALDGGAPLKEYAIGVDVFNRGANFDPRTDTIVRVQSRRLRDRLDLYYLGEGKDDSVRIIIEKGQYGVRFRRRPPTSFHEEIQSKAIDALRHLPAPRNSIIGREHETAQLLDLLGVQKVRLVTVTGPGGCGKTRLALHLSRLLAAELPGGARFVDLSTISTPDAVAPLLAREIGLRTWSGSSLPDALIEHARHALWKQVLLVVDNMEHVLTAAPLLGRLLDATAELRILATSRTPLAIYGEHLYPIQPLPLPDRATSPPEVLRRSPAVALFIERAKAVRPDWRFDASVAASVARLCARLDGLPLAIELAASQIRSRSADQMLELFGCGLDLPENPARDAPARQRTMRATIEWSHDRLSTEAKRVFRRLGVFRGSFSIEGAQAIVDAPRDLGLQLPTLIEELLAAGILHMVTPASHAVPRFRMLSPISEFARERLDASPEAKLVRRALCAWCLVLAEESGHTNDDSGLETWLSCWDAEVENLDPALDALLTQGNLDWASRICSGLFYFWERRARFAEGQRWISAVLARADGHIQPELLARLHICLGALMSLQGDFAGSDREHEEALLRAQSIGRSTIAAAAWNGLSANASFRGLFDRAAQASEACLELCRKLGEPSQLGAAICNHARNMLSLGNHSVAETLVREALEVYRSREDLQGIAWSTNLLGDALLAAGHTAFAEASYRRAGRIFQELGDHWGEARTEVDLGHLDLRAGRLESASTRFLSALDRFHGLRHERGVARLLEGCAAIAAHGGNSELAITLAGAAVSLRRRLGAAQRPIDQARLSELLAPAFVGVDGQVARDAWLRGQRLEYDQATALAKLAPATIRKQPDREGDVRPPRD